MGKKSKKNKKKKSKKRKKSSGSSSDSGKTLVLDGDKLPLGGYLDVETLKALDKVKIRDSNIIIQIDSLPGENGTFNPGPYKRSPRRDDNASEIKEDKKDPKKPKEQDPKEKKEKKNPSNKGVSYAEEENEEEEEAGPESKSRPRDRPLSTRAQLEKTEGGEGCCAMCYHAPCCCCDLDIPGSVCIVFATQLLMGMLEMFFGMICIGVRLYPDIGVEFLSEETFNVDMTGYIYSCAGATHFLLGVILMCIICGRSRARLIISLWATLSISAVVAFMISTAFFLVFEEGKLSHYVLGLIPLVELPIQLYLNYIVSIYHNTLIAVSARIEQFAQQDKDGPIDAEV